MAGQVDELSTNSTCPSPGVTTSELGMGLSPTLQEASVGLECQGSVLLCGPVRSPQTSQVPHSTCTWGRPPHSPGPEGQA